MDLVFQAQDIEENPVSKINTNEKILHAAAQATIHYPYWDPVSGSRPGVLCICIDLVLRGQGCNNDLKCHNMHCK